MEVRRGVRVATTYKFWTSGQVVNDLIVLYGTDDGLHLCLCYSLSSAPQVEPPAERYAAELE